MRTPPYIFSFSDREIQYKALFDVCWGNTARFKVIVFLSIPQQEIRRRFIEYTGVCIPTEDSEKGCRPA